ncbi:c-type cytochrome [Bradyrhizobium canariense]|uniref:Cytochrome C n=1 Tax=Bradyrhizobium canariense TaxID=255045 RepID=A0A1X3GCW5_9BRAD|nr:cytochrome c [Bradyrhizobium canariense]OSI60296.1 cytochrome C [Bradyrhizobium canariense]OSI65407.1 cytochrome C [Bradyrhizobium canariense]OSI75811.1 cytochrome C [Bradyrhizobium canariense]OSI85568.1 cytochrome C [Bradyrhizobium canariense]OSI87065.1 cytochrome C [Bradyrhizobium canariense]
MTARALPWLLLLSSVLAGCGDHSMSQQNRYGTFSKAGLFKDGTEAQALPRGVVAQGDLDRLQQITKAPAVDMALLARGRERYDIYCSPCHGFSGHGDGMIVQRGFPAPPSYHSARLRSADAQHFFDVITHGYGAMYSYAARVEPRDRWAIIAYIRALQQSQRTDMADVPELRSKLP